MSITPTLQEKFCLNKPSDIVRFFPRTKDEFEKTVALSNRIAHYFLTGIWVEPKDILNFAALNKLAISPQFSGMPAERKFKRIECGTFIPETEFGPKIKNGLQFLDRFMNDPKNIGALFPSSKYLAKEIVRIIPKLEPDSNETGRMILEIGPGTGSFTDKIIRRMGQKDVLHLVELEASFCKLLTEKYASLIQQGRLQIFNISILDHAPPTKYDFMVSGLPLNAFSPLTVQQIFDKLVQIGKVDSKLSYFEYLMLPAIKGIFSEQIREIQEIKDSFQKKYNLGRVDVLLNFPPAMVRHHLLNNK